MKIISMIPARYSASRFPAKLMQNLAGKTVILRTYEATVATKLFDEVYVVTDSDIIFNEIVNHGGKAIMSKKEHQSGSDRIAEAVEDLDVDIVVNVQGDEPFTERESLQKVLEVFKDDKKKEIDLASLMVEIHDWDEISNPNTVKVIVDQNNFALYFLEVQFLIQEIKKLEHATLSTKAFMPLENRLYWISINCQCSFSKLPKR